MTDDTTTTDASTDDRPPAAVRDGLRAATTPLGTTDPTADDADLAPVGEALADARVVGLGEATHGSREFFRLKHRILKHLVTDHGVRAFAMEANLPEAEALDQYVVHGEGDPAAALESVYFWTWQVASVLAMVEWLRAFNEGRPVEDRVRFHGFDAQYTQGAVERLRGHLGRVDPAFLEVVGDDLDAAADGAVPPHRAEDVAAEVEAVERVVPRLRDHLEEHRGTHVEATAERDWERARRYVTVMEQAAGYRSAAAGVDDIIGDEADAATLRRRDRAMADNVDWLLERAAAEPLVVWAHDGHLARTRQRARDGDAAATAMGGHLAERHGRDYLAVGFAFARGSFQAISEGPDGEYALREQHVDGPLPGTMAAALNALDEPLAYVDLRAAADDEATADWLAEPRRHLSAGATFDPDDLDRQLTEYVYGEAFDAVCFVAETTRARPLDDG